MNHQELIVHAARKFDREFTTEELVVAVWLGSPETFGLKGYELSYPDSNKVIVQLCGKNGLVARGLLSKVGPKRFLLLATDVKRNGQPARSKKPGWPGPRKSELDQWKTRPHAALLSYMKRVGCNGKEAYQVFQRKED
jgi:hypothetical protein